MTTLPTANVDTKEPQAQLRGAAMWLISSFALVGGGLLTSLSLGAMDSTAGDPQARTVAIVGFVTAITGVIMAITAAANMLLPSTFTYMDAIAIVDRPATQTERNKLKGEGGTTVSTYGDLVQLSFGSNLTLRALIRELNWATAERHAGRDTLLADADASYLTNKEMLESWMDEQALERLWRRFRIDKWVMLLGTLLTLVGGLTYALSTATDVVRARLDRENAVLAAELQLKKDKEMMEALEAGVRSEAAKWQTLPWPEEEDAAITEATLTTQPATAASPKTLNMEQATLVEQRSQALSKREQEVAEDQAALNVAPLLSLEFRESPAQATWTPVKGVGPCGTQAIAVAVQRLYFKQSSDPNRVGLVPAARIVTLSEGCAGLTKDITADDGTLTIPAQAWTLGAEVKSAEAALTAGAK